MSLAGKVALVTGSSQGIGQAIAIKLASEGASVVIDYRSHSEGAEDTLKQVEAVGGNCHLTQDHAPGGYVVQADLGNVNQIRNLVNEGIKHFGKLDILVNNAGLEKRAPFWEVTETDYDTVLNVNLKGAFFAAQALVQHLLETKHPGKVINMSSVHEDLPFPNFAPYCLSKGRVKMMARDLAVELEPYGITINNVAPGAIETPINTKLLNNP